MKNIYEQELLDSYLKKMKLDSVFKEEARKNMYLKRFENKETVMHKEEQIRNLSIVVEGTLKVIPFSGEGKDALIVYIKKGGLLGDIEYFCDGMSLHGVVSKGQSLILQIPYQVIEEELKDYPPFLLYISQKLAYKLHLSSKAHSEFLLYSTKSQLCKYIVDAVEKYGTQDIPAKNNELAQILGSSDRHIRRLISELIDEGLIKKERRGYIKVIDLETLKEKIKSNLFKYQR